LVTTRIWSQVCYSIINLKATFCQLMKVKYNEVWVLGLFSTTTFDFQRSLRVLTMKSNVKLAM
jgi:hypothetical protein